MRKSIIALLVLFCLTAPCLIIIRPSYADVVENWATKAPMHEARSNLGVVAVNGKIYAIGGSTQNGSSPYTGGVVSTNEEYDPVSETWTFKASMPTPRKSFAITAFQNKIYCIGGYDVDGDAVDVDEAYDPTTNTWETKAAMPTTRIALEANAANGKIYLIGGYIPGDYTTYTFKSSSLNEAYDPATNSWTTKAALPNGTSGYASAVLNNRIYVIGGVSNGPVDMLNQVYDPEADAWSTGAQLPASTAYAIAAVTTGVDAPERLYVFGKDEYTLEAPKVTRVYDPEFDNWTFASKVPTERRYFGVAALNDTFYVIGGMTEYYPYPALEALFPPSITVYATNEQYIPIEYGTMAPTVSLISPHNLGTYNETNISLAFTVNKPVFWVGYSLDGQENVTIVGNTTLSGLSTGLHNVTVYARDGFKNTGTSETATFSMAEQQASEPNSSSTTLIAVVIASVIVSFAGIIVYLRRRRH